MTQKQEGKKIQETNMGDDEEEEEEEDDGEEQEDVDLQVYNDGAAAACWATTSPSSSNYKSTREQKEGEKERNKGAPRLSKRKTKGTYYSLRNSC